jgi:hypothetical protein
VHLVAPNGGKALGSTVTVRWRSRDADRNRRWYTVLYAADGAHFVPVATGLTRTSLRVDLTALPGGPHARFEVLASDGVRTAGDASDRTFAVAVKAPLVSIATPADKAELPAGEPISLTGSALDLQDGSLDGSRLEWSSSIQGSLGTGVSVTATLKPGKHVITLTATNSAGVSAEATVTVTVSAPPPVMVATIEPNDA